MFELKIKLLKKIEILPSGGETWKELINKLEKNDYLTKNMGRDGENYFWYFDGFTEGAFRISDESFIDKTEIETLFC